MKDNNTKYSYFIFWNFIKVFFLSMKSYYVCIKKKENLEREGIKDEIFQKGKIERRIKIGKVRNCKLKLEKKCYDKRQYKYENNRKRE